MKLLLRNNKLQFGDRNFIVYRVERLVSKDTTIEGIFLPAGSMVSAMIYAVHHDPETWPEPNKFDPER